MKKLIHILCLLAMYGCITMCMDQPPLLSLKPAGMGDLINHFYNVPHEVAQLSSELQEIIITKKKHPRFLYPKNSFDCGSLVTSVAFSSNGMLATGSSDGIVRIFDTTTWKRIKALKHGDWVRSIAFSSDGKLATGCDDGKVRVFDTTTWKRIKVLKHGDWVRSIAFSSDGKLATGSDNGVRIFDTTTWKCIKVLKHSHFLCPVAFSSDGKLATGYDNGVRIFDTTTWKRIKVFKYGDWVRSIAFSSDGKQLATGGDKKVRIFEWYTPHTWHEGLLLRIIFMWLNVAKHSKKIKNFNLMLADIAETFALTCEVESSFRAAWESFSIPLRKFIWDKSNHIIQTYGK